MTTLAEFSGHPLVHALGWTLLHFLWQGTLAALVLWLVLGLLGGRSSQARYGAACFALALMVAMPLLTFARIAAAEYKTRSEFQQSAIAIDSGLMLQVGLGELAAPWPVRIAVALDRWVPWLLAAWFVGAIFFMVRLNLGLVVARRLKRAGTQAPLPELQHLFDILKLRLGVVRAVTLLQSARVQVPTVIGWLRPAVLIPASCLTGLSTLQIEAIFCHELAHVRRHDYLVSVFQSIAESLLFYHPAIWWVSKQVRRERECCCDEIAVGNGGDVLAYAKALSYLEERRAAFPEFVLGANGGVLKMRIKRLLGCRDDVAASQFAALTLVALIVAVGGSYVATVARAQPKTTQPAPLTIVATNVTPDSTQGQAASLTRTQTDPDIAQEQSPHGAYKAWVNQDVTYIITPEERAAFLRLANDDERDKFIEDFWERRNPAPGSAENPFRDEHYARIAYANQHFATNDQPGWKTDRGHIYIVYGKPESIDSHPSGGISTYPFETWHYPSIGGIGDNVDLKFVDTCRCGNYNYTIDGLAPGPGTSALQTRQFDRLSLATKIMEPAKVSYAPQGAAPPPSANASQGDGAIAGTIIDPTGALVPRASVRATNTNMRLTMIKTTDNSGTYSLSPLPPGKYNIEVMAKGFQGLHQENVQVDGGEKVGLNLKLRVGTVNERLTVIGQPVAVALPAPPPPPPVGPAGDRPVGPLRVSSGTMAGALISRTDPVYPPDAKAAHVEGVVVLRATISKLGTIENLQVVSGPPPLLVSAIDAVRQWKYKPFLLNGEPTEVETTLNINYTIGDTAQQQAQNEAADAIPGVKKIGGSVSTPVVTYQVEPEFTVEARKAKFMGVVLVNLIVDTNGMPQKVHVVRGVGLGLDEKAVQAVKQYKFKPAMENGNPVPVNLNVEVNFQVF